MGGGTGCEVLCPWNFSSSMGPLLGGRERIGGGVAVETLMALSSSLMSKEAGGFKGSSDCPFDGSCTTAFFVRDAPLCGIVEMTADFEVTGAPFALPVLLAEFALVCCVCISSGNLLPVFRSIKPPFIVEGRIISIILIFRTKRIFFSPGIENSVQPFSRILYKFEINFWRTYANF
jgi:hypothetical protein